MANAGSRRVGVDEITHRIIGCAIRVHEELGPALLESGYQAALGIEFREQALEFEAQKTIPAFYLTLMKCQVGLLINFHVPLLTQGVKRVVRDYIEPHPTAPLLNNGSLEPG